MNVTSPNNLHNKFSYWFSSSKLDSSFSTNSKPVNLKLGTTRFRFFTPHLKCNVGIVSQQPRSVPKRVAVLGHSRQHHLAESPVQHPRPFRVTTILVKGRLHQRGCRDEQTAGTNRSVSQPWTIESCHKSEVKNRMNTVSNTVSACDPYLFSGHGMKWTCISLGSPTSSTTFGFRWNFLFTCCNLAERFFFSTQKVQAPTRTKTVQPSGIYTYIYIYIHIIFIIILYYLFMMIIYLCVYYVHMSVHNTTQTLKCTTDPNWGRNAMPLRANAIRTKLSSSLIGVVHSQLLHPYQRSTNGPPIQFHMNHTWDQKSKIKQHETVGFWGRHQSFAFFCRIPGRVSKLWTFRFLHGSDINGLQIGRLGSKFEMVTRQMPRFSL